MESVNRTIQGLAEEYLTEWQVQKDYLRKINRNNEKLIKYTDDAIMRKGAYDYRDRLKMVLDILQHLGKLDSKFKMHKNETDRIRTNIIKLNPHKKI